VTDLLRAAAPPSPCVGVCRLDEKSGFCLGCARTRAEIASWTTGPLEWRRKVWEELSLRRAALGLSLHRLDWATNDIRSFVAGTMRPNGGVWVGGVYGAVAEFCVGPNEALEVVCRDDAITAVTARAAIRIGFSGKVRALSFADDRIIMLAVPRRDGPAAPSGLSALGPDIGAIRPRDCAAHLYDFGLGTPSSSFGIRSADAGLQQRLSRLVGLRWPELLVAAGGDILAWSPPRVVASPIGRIEIFTPIPRPGERTQPGPHTHFLPALLAAGRVTPPGMDLPEAYAACLIHYPAESGAADHPH
jgi:predicted Fe-S protein YdhL (DUF1289 family)